METKAAHLPAVLVGPTNYHVGTHLSHVCQAAADGSRSDPGMGHALTHVDHPLGAEHGDRARADNSTHGHSQAQQGDGTGPGREPSREQQEMGPEIGPFLFCCQAVQRMPTHSS